MKISFYPKTKYKVLVKKWFWIQVALCSLFGGMLGILGLTLKSGWWWLFVLIFVITVTGLLDKKMWKNKDV